MIVEDFLPEVKANRYTYYNLNNDFIKRYQKLYGYLKRHKDKGVGADFLFNYSNFDNSYYTEYSNKYTKMVHLSNNIIH
jgi:hypothetical protein